MHKVMTMGLDAFMDYTTHLIGNNTTYLLSLLIPDAQCNVDLWQGIILASGGTLNPSKCSWTPFLWSFNNQFGNPTLLNPLDCPSNCITALKRARDQHILHCNKPQDTIRLLGVHITTDGNYVKELSVLCQQQNQYCAFLHHTLLRQ